MSDARESLGLPSGFQVGRYRLEKIHAAWGFYLTYLASDTDGRAVAVHELLPEELVTRAADGAVSVKSEAAKESLVWARECFLREGRALMASAHPALQEILEVFEANGTAYWVTPRDEPRTFKDWLRNLGRSPNETELRHLLRPLLSALQRLHAAGLFHLNLKPDSIQITPSGHPVLEHFGGARQAIARHCFEAAAVTTGYSPPEQYNLEENEGAWTDIYGLAAVFYRAITGHAPPDAEQRLDRDPYEPLAGRFAGQYRETFLAAIDTALALDPSVRPGSVGDWREKLGIAAGDNLSGYLRRYRTFSLIGFAAVVTIAMALSFVFRPRPSPTPSPTPIPTPTKTITPVSTPTATPTPVLTPTSTPTPTPTPATPVPTPTPTPTPATPVPIPIPVVTPKPTPTPMPIASATPVPTPKPALTPTASSTPAPTPTPNPTHSAAISPTPTLTSPSVTPSPTAESSNSPKNQHTGAKSELEKRAKEKAERAAEESKKAEAAKRAAEASAKAKAEAEKAAVAQKTAKVADSLAKVQKAISEEAAASKTLAEVTAAEKQAAEAATRLANEARAQAGNKELEKAAAAAQGAERDAARKTAQAKEAVAGKSVATASAKEGFARATAELKTLQARSAAAKAEESKKEAATKEDQTAKAAQDAAVKAKAEEARKKAEEAQRDAANAAAEKDKAEKWVAEAAAETEAKKQAAAKIAAERIAAEKAAQERQAAQMAAQKAAAAAEKAAAEKAAAEKAGHDPNAGKYKQSKTTPPPGPTPDTNNRQGSTGTGLAGIWETTSTDAQGKPNRRLIIYDDGRYQISDNQGWRDSGVILAKTGRIQMLSDATGIVVRSSFRFRTLSKIVTAGALGDEEWQRVQASPGDDPNKGPKK